MIRINNVYFSVVVVIVIIIFPFAVSDRLHCVPCLVVKQLWVKLFYLFETQLGLLSATNLDRGKSFAGRRYKRQVHGQTNRQKDRKREGRTDRHAII